jgi:hypothetical protein
MIRKADFPQADRLLQVGDVARAIGAEKRSDKEIEAFIGLDSKGRQGRYYRLAAKILGLIENQSNRAVLTPVGQEYKNLHTKAARIDFLARCLIDTPVFREALQYIHKQRPTDDQLRLWFNNFYPGASTTAKRRYSTFVSYLRDAHLLTQSGGTNQLSRYAGAVMKQTASSPKKGLYGTPTKDKNAPRADLASGAITYDVDAQKLERANQTHWQLVAAKSAFLGERGWPAYENEQIDLYATTGAQTIIYEMKSINSETSNQLSQIRKAISQLYEYRFIFNEPKAALCIVTNAAIAKKDAWLLGYLAKDREIAYEWTKDFESFECQADSKSLLKTFSP